MPLNFRKGLTRGASGALTAATTGNPQTIALSALASGLPGLFEKDRKFDPSPYRDAFRQYAAGVRGGARRAAQEAGSTLGSGLAARGLGKSPLGVGIVAGNQRLALQRAEDRIAQDRGQLELELANAQAGVDAANRADRNADLAGVSDAAISLAGNVATKDSRLREILGLPKIAPDTTSDDTTGWVQIGDRAKSAFGRSMAPVERNVDNLTGTDLPQSGSSPERLGAPTGSSVDPSAEPIGFRAVAEIGTGEHAAGD